MLTVGGSSSSSAANPNRERHQFPIGELHAAAGPDGESDHEDDADEEGTCGQEFGELVCDSLVESKPGETLVAATGSQVAARPGAVARGKKPLHHIKRLLVSYPWCEEQDVPAWSHRAQSLLQELVDPPREHLAKEEQAADVDARNVRIPSVSETAEEMMQEREAAEGLEAPVRKKQKSVTKDARPKQPCADAIDAADPVLTYEEISEQRRRKCNSKAAALLQDPVPGASWHQSGKINVLVNALNNSIRGSPHKRALHRIVARYTGQHFFDEAADHECTPPDLANVPEEVVRVSPEEVIISVAVCSPSGHKDQEYDILASQTLYDLRDAFYFVSDWMYDGVTRLASACMFIDGVFYNDLRHEAALDYSKDLIDWIKVTGSRDLKENPSRTMDVRLCDLGRIPFGEKCLYMRNGFDEHHMYFTGARLYDAKTDCPLVDAYPCLTFMKTYHKRRCVACLQHPAIWVVLDSSRCPINPGFWCELCFRHFFQDKDGNYIPPVDYKLFPYLHDE